MKRVLAMHDISTIGRASLTMCIPVISSFNMQVCPLVTAVLSATTNYEGFEIIDLTNKLENFISSWKNQNENFDIFYSGFLGSNKQQKIIENMFKLIKFEKIIIDPVFADNGILYPIFNQKIVNGFRNLIKHANIITPNITELKMLAKTEEIKNKDEMIKAISSLEIKGITVVTSVENKNLIGTIAYNTKTKEYSETFLEKLEQNFGGTGDLFASLLIGYLEKLEIEHALEKATKVIHSIIKYSIENNTPTKGGIQIEKFLKNIF
ncbi:pyridoxamine kinase [Borrelia miyamotoi]|uniref:pyridoxal kinase n=1 Tax=Borrelia miyamotoi TaxID=47466 RepID=A0ABN5DV31_9SPIR|nr:pyridoxamine kinase [Borrelia miyamotoi]ATQ15684.1 pyridoxamine kinase [Borrelia miyamotoi]ATQ18669.1 pyridoxamine kinase [Borrelia miyamotoi]QBK62910.1 pyridoxamine kinase [Borrelia miyamotoi]QBK64208.1 pyridoxamine kinase [Borrelia miyamotoi]QBL98375.1 pyridoxamine kinase [Borrelia miyamotoi]